MYGLTRRELLLAAAGTLGASRSLLAQSPTKRYVEKGYDFDETSDEWKKMCTVLPCFAALHWPDYSTKVVEDRIGGREIVIQLWKGWCPQFLGLANFPGGVGGEVGIYRRIPGKPWPSQPAGFPSAAWLAFRGMGLDQDLWWPVPELNTEIEWDFINPVTKEVFFHAGKQTTYWCNKWMETQSYNRYKAANKVPSMGWDYTMKYTINGKTYPAW